VPEVYPFVFGNENRELIFDEARNPENMIPT
jgi:hypothetical protein